MTELSDEQLMAQLQGGRIDALELLYSRYARQLYVFCSHVTQAADAQDLVQDVFLRVLRSAGTFDPRKASLRTWLFRIARNHCIDLSRHQQRIQWVSLNGTDKRDASAASTSPAETIADQSQHVERSVIENAALQAVHDCIRELESNDERQAIILYYLNNKVYREIGQVLKKSTSMARNHVKSAGKKIKRCLERKGIDSFA